MKLNLGCGKQVVAGWTNVDYAPGARLARLPLFGAINRRLRLFRADWHKGIILHDLTKPFPWPEGSVDVVYSSHTLEHFSKEEGLKFLKECHRVLRGGGIIRILVPDLACTVQRYCAGELRAEDFVAELGVLYRSSLRGLRGKLSFMIRFPHKCMYDTPALLGALSNTGFAAQSRGPLESDIPQIEEIEIPSRTEQAVIVEGTKR